MFSCNEGNWFDYPEFVRTFLMQCKERSLTARYVGSAALGRELQAVAAI